MNNRSDSIAKIAPALLRAQKEMGNAVKDSKNPFFKSKFADLNSVREAVTPALHNNGISILQLNTTLSFDGGNIRDVVRTTLLHESGEYITSDTNVVCSKQNDPQSYGSALSYARRYGLSSMLSVGAEDDDGEGSTTRQPAAVSRVGKPVAAAPPVTNGAAQQAQSAATANSFGSFRKGSS